MREASSFLAHQAARKEQQLSRSVSSQSQASSRVYKASLFDNEPPKLLPNHKSGRVKVGVRCRPPFPDEAPSNRPFVPSVACSTGGGLAKVQLRLDGEGKQRDFFFDYVFGLDSTQQQIYDLVGGPIISDVLRGFNGTIFAYGQTGTGKTYTMGILDRVRDQTAGVIPRALGHIFGHTFGHEYETARPKTAPGGDGVSATRAPRGRITGQTFMQVGSRRDSNQSAPVKVVPKARTRERMRSAGPFPLFFCEELGAEQFTPVFFSVPILPSVRPRTFALKAGSALHTQASSVSGPMSSSFISSRSGKLVEKLRARAVAPNCAALISTAPMPIVIEMAVAITS